MIFYGDFKTTTGLPETPVIDFIEFEFSDNHIKNEFVPDDLKEGNGIQLCCSWDESDWCYDPEDGTGSFRCKGVAIGEHYTNGALDMFVNSVITYMQVFFRVSREVKRIPFSIVSFEIVDGEEAMRFGNEQFSEINICEEFEIN